MLQTLSALKRFTVRAEEGDLGRPEGAYFDDRSWRVRYLSVSMGKRLLGRRVLVIPQSIADIDVEERRLHAALSREQVEKSPPLESERVLSRDYERRYYEHFGWVPYWQSAEQDGEDEARDEGAERSPHLHAASELAGCGIETRDGAEGHVADLVLDLESWMIRYLEVDTRRWLPGRKVLLAPAWIERLSWGDRTVVAALDRGTIESAPDYEPDKPITRDYEIELYKHYGSQQYWD